MRNWGRGTLCIELVSSGLNGIKWIQLKNMVWSVQFKSRAVGVADSGEQSVGGEKWLISQHPIWSWGLYSGFEMPSWWYPSSSLRQDTLGFWGSSLHAQATLHDPAYLSPFLHKRLRLGVWSTHGVSFHPVSLWSSSLWPRIISTSTKPSVSVWNSFCEFASDSGFFFFQFSVSSSCLASYPFILPFPN